MSEIEFIDIFSGNLRELMQEFGYNQQALADAAKLDKSIVSRYLAGKTMPTVKGLVNLSIALNCTVDELVGNSIDYIW